jgi:hypothetical protein
MHRFSYSKINSQRNNSQIQHLNGTFIMVRRKLQWSELYTNSVNCYSLKIKTCRGQGLETPLLRVNRHINSFIHSTLSRIPSLSSNCFYCPSLFLLASPLPSLFASTFIILMHLLWKANRHMIHFHFQLFLKEKCKQK